MIELLISLVIVGMIAAFAVPQYSKYVARSEMVEVVTLTDAIRVAMIDTHTRTGRFVTANHGDWDLRNAEVGIEDTDAYETDVIGLVWVGMNGTDQNSGHIVVQLTEAMSKVGINDSTVRLHSNIDFDVATQSYTFTCNVDTTNGIAADYIDGLC